MSERRDSTCQKHDLPKSLQGTEDAEFVWSMIIDRFPNAAPLLCEMESVIDRAEDLLQQLRTPCREIETSTSFCTPESEDSTAMISARESIFTDNDNAEESTEKNVAETQISQSTMCEEDADVNGQRSTQDTTSQSSDLLMIYNSNEEKNSNSVGEESTSKIETDHQQSCITLHRQEKSPDVSDSAILVDSELTMKNQVFVETKDDSANGSARINITGSGDESISEQRTPLSILEGYSKRCNVPVVYEYVTDGPHRHKPNIYVIRGSLGGFSTTYRGQTEESTKNGLATGILQMIANCQIADTKLAPLAKLSKEEMMDIFNLGMDSSRETSQRKLYQLCLERGEQFPKYSVNKMETFQGMNYVATCTALGYTGEGRGVRECVAKRAAADELYNQYCRDAKTALKIFAKNTTLESDISQMSKHIDPQLDHCPNSVPIVADCPPARAKIRLGYFGDNPGQLASFPKGPIVVQHLDNDQEYQQR